ncbi:hypothetical protein J6590_041236 [Homalodisca vitripennis]|nr:hypothetical protein J6590_041236 [Homalodisca vitripennis]
MISRDVVEEVYYVAEINISISTAAVDCREARVVMAGGIIHQQWVGEGECYNTNTQGRSKPRTAYCWNSEKYQQPVYVRHYSLLNETFQCIQLHIFESVVFTCYI